MDYTTLYTNTFNDINYSNIHHYQYDFVLQTVVSLNKPSNSIIDIGSGRGQAIVALNNLKAMIPNYSITSVDLKRFHNVEVNQFIECNLSVEDDRKKLLKNKYDMLVCTDVFEHLDKTFINQVIEMCSHLAPTAILAIANHSDIFDGIELHTIQENDTWWDDRLSQHFIINKKTIKPDLYLYVCESKNYS